MPSSSAKQSRFMAAIAHSPSFAKKVGVSQSVGKDFNAADKGKTFNKGGTMKKLAGGGLSDLETRMVPYAKLSDKRKAEIKSQYEKDVKEAEANVKRPFGSKVLDAYYEVNPLVSEKQRQSVRSDAAEDVAQRQRKLGYAKGQLEELGTRKEYFSNDVPHKINPNEKLFRKGGAIMKESKGMMGKEVAFMKKKGAPASMIKHEKAEAGMKKGGMPMKDGKPAFMKKFAKGGGIESRGKTKGTMVRMASGGSVSSASRRADGIAQRGKTRC